MYVAKDEDEEVSIITETFDLMLLIVFLQLLSVSPSRNALSLVFCDQETLSFTKYINHRTEHSSFFPIAFTYLEPKMSL